jgi:AbrB family looped-hinge helix DNA binding protein
MEDCAMQTKSIKVSSRGYVVLPAKIRKEMNIMSGTQILLTREKDRIILQPVNSFTEELSGLTKGSFGKTASEIERYFERERKSR